MLGKVVKAMKERRLAYRTESFSCKRDEQGVKACPVHRSKAYGMNFQVIFLSYRSLLCASTHHINPPHSMGFQRSRGTEYRNGNGVTNEEMEA